MHCKTEIEKVIEFEQNNRKLWYSPDEDNTTEMRCGEYVVRKGGIITETFPINVDKYKEELKNLKYDYEFPKPEANKNLSPLNYDGSQNYSHWSDDFIKPRLFKCNEKVKVRRPTLAPLMPIARHYAMLNDSPIPQALFLILAEMLYTRKSNIEKSEYETIMKNLYVDSAFSLFMRDIVHDITQLPQDEQAAKTILQTVEKKLPYSHHTYCNGIIEMIDNKMIDGIPHKIIDGLPTIYCTNEMFYRRMTFPFGSFHREICTPILMDKLTGYSGMVFASWYLDINGVDMVFYNDDCSIAISFIQGSKNGKELLGVKESVKQKQDTIKKFDISVNLYFYDASPKGSNSNCVFFPSDEDLIQLIESLQKLKKGKHYDIPLHCHSCFFKK